MVRFFIVCAVIITIWCWIILTWIHVVIQAINFGGYVYQPYKKSPSIVRKAFTYILYPFCCNPIEGFEIKLVPAREAYKRLLVVTVLWTFVTFLGISSERRRLSEHRYFS